MLTCICAGLVAFVLRFGTDNLIPSPNYGALLVIGTLLTVIVFPMTGLYRSWRTRNPLAPAGRALVAWCLVFAALLIVLVLGKQAEHFSRLWLAAWFLAGALLLVLLRWLTYGLLKLLRQRGYNRRYVVIVGGGEHARELLRQVSNSLSSGFRVLAVFNDVEGVKDIWGHPLLPTAGLVDFVHQQVVDEIWLALPLEQSHRLRNILAQLSNCPANVRYIPDFRDLYLLNHGVSDVLGIPMIDLTSSPLQGNGMLVKVLEDRLLAAVILLLASPLMLLIALGVKLSSPGPVLYRQKRHGWDGRAIEVYKFRTMRVHKEQAGRVTQASPDDGRFTPIGGWLRRTSLDELPQFFNVLQGRMSIVGPRPHAVEHNEQYRAIINRYMLRHLVKPGITGWAQINGLRGMTETPDKMQKRVEFDFYYIENWSLWFDLKIIVLTFFMGFVNKNAY
ncbi:MAG: undecaprenyl-phosphate glucose phosphotransferase [Gammaproteobacteria bacterium]|nr:undecaprenyl-phosphate glucose phosphotransferase [Gammaproteobacteria bacterium]